MKNDHKGTFFHRKRRRIDSVGKAKVTLSMTEKRMVRMGYLVKHVLSADPWVATAKSIRDGDGPN